MTSTKSNQKYDVAIVGGGFTGLSAALALSKAGKRVCVLDSQPELGGLAANFEFTDGVELERFYHHWFNHDKYINELLDDLNLSDRVVWKNTNTGMYFNKRIWKLSSPLDLIRFKPLSFISRIRLGAATLIIPLFKDWKKIEHLSIREWLLPLVGKEAYDLVWAPLVNSKFSTFSEEVNAVWMWKKLALRGSTRSNSGGEQLGYFVGGFGRLANEIANNIRQHNGFILGNSKVTSLGTSADGKEVVNLVLQSGEVIESEEFIFTNSFQEIAEIIETLPDLQDWKKQLLRVNYLGNICLVLRMKNSLSETYWLNVNDPGFPFVGVIEHTNFDKPESFGNSHIAYLSAYVDKKSDTWGMSDNEYFEDALSHIQRMFPDFSSDWIIEYKIWRSEYAQPVTEKLYSEYLPGHRTPLNNLSIYTMAQIYPEDRGTNYAIREGFKAAKSLLEKLG